MKMLLRTLVISAAFLFIGSPVVAADNTVPSINSLSEAINQAGRQRMLTQRIIKAYAQSLLDVAPDTAIDQIDDAIVLFESQLQNLTKYAPNPEIKSQIEHVASLWTPYRNAAMVKDKADNLHQLASMNEGLLQAAHTVVQALENLSTAPAGRLVNIAGRQRMLSQRVAKFYLLRSYGFENDEIKKELETAANEFRAALAELSKAPDNTSEISAGLVEVAKQWTVFEKSFSLPKGQSVPLMIAMYSEKVLKQMNQITGLYAGLKAS